MAGPLLIVACVLFALRGFLVDGGLTNQHPDLLTFWLPRWSFLGRSVAAGHVPIWNPFEMAGYRFAADPQSGWLYAPPMLLFSTLGPGLALRLFVLWNPLLAGLGLHAFLRSETVSRPGATVGGLVLAMTMATSTIAISLPFAGALAWTTVLLLAASRYRSRETWSARLAWLALGGLAWWQVGAAHLSHGLLIATAFVVSVLAAGAVADVRAGALPARVALGRSALFLIALPIAALPILVPHVDLLGASSLRGGYGALDDPGQTTVGDPLGQEGLWAGWPLGFAAAPGAYAGAAALACVALAGRRHRLRPLAVASGGLLLAAFALTSVPLVTAGWFRDLVLAVPFGDVYLHNPGRLRYAAVLAVPVLAACGLDGLIDRPLPRRTAFAWLAGAGAVLVALPIVAGGNPVRYAMIAASLVAAAPVLFAVATRRRAWAAAPVVAGVVALELLGSAVYSQSYRGGTIFTGLESGAHPILVPQVLRWPELDQDRYLRATAIVEHLRREPGRYATWAPPEAFFEKGYLWMRSAADWPALAPSRGTLFGVPDALGYNPVQLPRYWRYVRATNELSVFYNASVLNSPSVQDLRLLGLRYLVVPSGIRPTLPGRVVVRADRYSLWELFERQPLATATGDVAVVADADEAVEAVTEPGFDPARVAVIDGPTGRVEDVTAPPAIAEVASASPTRLRLRLPSEARGVLTVRNAFDPGWRATADGRPARTLPVDGFLQGVVLPAGGAREIVLTYEDPAVRLGLALGAAVWALGLAAPLAALAVERRRRRRSSGPTPPLPERPVVGAPPR